jgi:glycosyltransferase involved in cell wall biosynthesis
MRVLLDNTYAVRAPHAGTAIYLDRLAAALRETGQVELETVANPARRPPAGGGLGSLRNLLDDERWARRELPRRARLIGAELIHHPLPAGGGAGLPEVVSVHDLAFERLPEQFDSAFRRYAHLRHRAAARRAAAVICVSRETAEEVIAFWGVPRARVVVAPHGPGQVLTLRPRVPPTHFLYVGDDEPRKDLGALLAGYTAYRSRAEEPLALVLAGRIARTVGAGVRIQAQPPADRVAELHAGAAALVHTSRLEGFGLTLLEAMSVGTPVVAVIGAAVRELCGDAALYVPAGAPERLADALSRLSSDGAMRAQLAERGQARAAAFSWKLSAERHLEAYSLALSR